MTDFEIIPNRKKKQLKYQYNNYTNSTPLSSEFIADQKRRSMRFVKKGGKK
jgi:hypothetical protein